MYCRSCGKQLVDQAVVCTGCGSKPRAGHRFCWQCGAETPAGPQQAVCTKCGVSLSDPFTSAVNALVGTPRSKVVAGLLQLLPLVGIPGGFGRLYLGYTGVGVAQLVTSFLCVGYFWSIIDGIMILTGSVLTDGHGQPLQQ
jgi:hypothetical protein